MVFDVWDSIEELDAFTATQMPILAGEHIDMAPPEPLEIHDLIDGSDSTALRTTIAELRDKAFFIRPIEKLPPASRGRRRNVQPSLDRERRCQLMVNVGDRIRLSSTKGPDRDGVVTAVTGSLLRVRWPSEEETTLAPAPGTLTVLAATETVKETVPTKKAAGKKKATRTEDHLGQEGDARQHPVANEGGQTTIALINAPITTAERRRLIGVSGERPPFAWRAPRWSGRRRCGRFPSAAGTSRR